MAVEKQLPERVALFFGWADSPVWYRTPGDAGPVDLGALPVSEHLRRDLDTWNRTAGTILSANDYEWPDTRTRDRSTAEGHELARRLHDELGIEVVYTPDGDEEEPTVDPMPERSGTGYTWVAYRPGGTETFPPGVALGPDDE